MDLKDKIKLAHDFVRYCLRLTKSEASESDIQRAAEEIARAMPPFPGPVPRRRKRDD